MGNTSSSQHDGVDGTSFIDDPDPSKTALDAQNGGSMMDVVVMSDGERVSECHRLVLSAFSRRFKKDLIAQQHLPLIELHYNQSDTGISKEVLKEVIEYCSTGNYKFSSSLLDASRFLECDTLTTVLESAKDISSSTINETVIDPRHAANFLEALCQMRIDGEFIDVDPSQMENQREKNYPITQIEGELNLELAENETSKLKEYEREKPESDAKNEEIDHFKMESQREKIVRITKIKSKLKSKLAELGTVQKQMANGSTNRMPASDARATQFEHNKANESQREKIQIDNAFKQILSEIEDLKRQLEYEKANGIRESTARKTKFDPYKELWKAIARHVQLRKRVSEAYRELSDRYMAELKSMWANWKREKDANKAESDHYKTESQREKNVRIAQIELELKLKLAESETLKRNLDEANADCNSAAEAGREYEFDNKHQKIQMEYALKLKSVDIERLKRDLEYEREKWKLASDAKKAEFDRIQVESQREKIIRLNQIECELKLMLAEVETYKKIEGDLTDSKKKNKNTSEETKNIKEKLEAIRPNMKRESGAILELPEIKKRKVLLDVSQDKVNDPVESEEKVDEIIDILYALHLCERNHLEEFCVKIKSSGFELTLKEASDSPFYRYESHDVYRLEQSLRQLNHNTTIEEMVIVVEDEPNEQTYPIIDALFNFKTDRLRLDGYFVKRRLNIPQIDYFTLLGLSANTRDVRINACCNSLSAQDLSSLRKTMVESGCKLKYFSAEWKDGTENFFLEECFGVSIEHVFKPIRSKIYNTIDESVKLWSEDVFDSVYHFDGDFKTRVTMKSVTLEKCEGVAKSVWAHEKIKWGYQYFNWKRQSETSRLILSQIENELKSKLAATEVSKNAPTTLSECLGLEMIGNEKSKDMMETESAGELVCGMTNEPVLRLSKLELAEIKMRQAIDTLTGIKREIESEEIRLKSDQSSRNADAGYDSDGNPRPVHNRRHQPDGTMPYVLDNKQAPEKERFQCSECVYKSGYKKSVQTHIRSMHTGECPFVCRHCGKKEASQSNLKRHERSHTQTKPYKCLVCNKVYADRKNIERHMWAEHVKQGQCQCARPAVWESRFSRNGIEQAAVATTIKCTLHEHEEEGAARTRTMIGI